MQKKQIYVALLLMFTIVTTSCKKDNSIDVATPIENANNIMQKPQGEQIKYAEANLKKIATAFGALAKDPAFVNYVHAETAKKFSGEYCALIETMQKNPTWANKLNTSQINEGLNAFKNLSGSNFYPQIYIPKMQHDEDINNTPNFVNSNSTTTTEDVKICVYAGSEPIANTIESFSGYIINETDSTLDSLGPINEQYADENEVWVFSLNEVVNNSGSLLELPGNDCTPSNPNYPECTYSGGGGSGGGSGSGGTVSPNDVDPSETARGYHPEMNTNNPVNCKITSMTVRDHHEHWVAGQSEVSIRAVLNTINGYKLGDMALGVDQYVSTIGKTSILGKLICNVNRKTIKNKLSFPLNFTLQTGWPTNILNSGPVFYDYIIFEKDNWPTGKAELERYQNQYNRIALFSSTDTWWEQTTRDSHGYYDIGRITNYTNQVSASNAPVYTHNIGNSVGGFTTFYYTGVNRSSYDNSITFNVNSF